MTGRQGNAYSCGSRMFTGKQTKKKKKKKDLKEHFPSRSLDPSIVLPRLTFRITRPSRERLEVFPRKYAYSKKNDSKIKLEFFLFKTQCSLSCRPQSVHYNHSILKYKQIAQGHKKCDEI